MKKMIINATYRNLSIPKKVDIMNYCFSISNVHKKKEFINLIYVLYIMKLGMSGYSKGRTRMLIFANGYLRRNTRIVL